MWGGRFATVAAPRGAQQRNRRRRSGRPDLTVAEHVPASTVIVGMKLANGCVSRNGNDGETASEWRSGGEPNGSDRALDLDGPRRTSSGPFPRGSDRLFAHRRQGDLAGDGARPAAPCRRATGSVAHLYTGER